MLCKSTTLNSTDKNTKTDRLDALVTYASLKVLNNFGIVKYVELFT